ncbi:Apo-citrate lyase phosphoribosyl-dephospho-CoA transferase [Vibrio ruber DSM 16370]|uniref:citrate lyase holo-[acyl-carrier protein] synthase n=1 Tax=Vibrio ruber (strain DSM 16370 / JCM 11486 / BCRC 17186 / CECT 7878 / LMG 23124 / VR1) TaxID=1123498 RepID=A0A1R4LIL4_VIBR1|nr:citrate lyase holo-[acyl-carrier protein] synthase [Vibrio ruber]SJN56432.1 Apo-citrate lyase phosphoribosyl-dephospho-CoA transferase [Vibrio ruber DSM 16370]
MTHIAEETPVQLCELLACKEQRAKTQLAWLRTYGVPLVSFSINMPGPVKLNAVSEQIFAQGLAALEAICHEQGWTLIAQQIHHEKTGPEGIFAVQGVSASILKKQMMHIEKTHPTGRLMDLDVIDKQGKSISRKAYQIGRRKCLLCEEDAVICARSRRHPLQALLAKIEEMVHADECCH